MISIVALPSVSPSGLSTFAHAETLVIDADTQYHYAQHLFSTGQYDSAIHEFNRFLYFFPTHGKAESAMFQVGDALFRSNRFQEAEATFIRVLEKAMDKELTQSAYFMIAECRFKLNDVNGAAISLKRLISITPDPAVKDRAWHRLGWLFVEAGDWENARNAFQELSIEGTKKYRSGNVLKELESWDTIERKNPTAAGFLSIVPGAGHLYCSRPQDAAIAFVLNSALVGSAWQAFDRDLTWLGGVLTLVELGVYSGTVYSAVSSTHKFNRRQVHHFIEKLKQQATPVLSLSPAPNGFQVSLNIDFN